MKLMNFRSNLLLLTALLSASDINCGFEMLSKIGTPMIRAGYSATLHSSRRYCSGAEFRGECVSIDSDGVVTIKREKYPEFSGKQSVAVRPHIVSELMFDAHKGMPYHYVEFDNLKNRTQATNNETIIDQSSQFNIISSDKVQDTPYFAVGRLDMLYKKDDKFIIYHGSGAAIDTDCIITAAHNIHDAKEGMAEEVYFQHMLTGEDKLGHSKISTQFFVHPKWTDGFEEKYDIALVFLSQNLDLTEVQKGEILKLRVLKETQRTLRVIGYPNGVVNMSESFGKEVRDEKGDLENMVYHLANTEPGNSGSPIISECLHIIGTHTNGFSPYCKVQANNGVKVRPDILKFIDDSVKSYQDSLNDNKSGDIQEEEQAMMNKWISRGESTKALEIAKNLKLMNLTVNQIETATGLTVAEINSI